MAGTRRATLREASEELGVSVEAVRKRVKRRSLRSGKDPDGRVYVYLAAGGDASHPEQERTEGRMRVWGAGQSTDHPGAPPELVEELRDRVRFLEEQLESEREARTEERRRHDTLMAQLIQRLPELEAPQEPSEAPQAAAQEPEGQSPALPAQALRRAYRGRGGGGCSGDERLVSGIEKPSVQNTEGYFFVPRPVGGLVLGPAILSIDVLEFLQQL